MQLTFLKSKLHKAVVTATELEYEGSVAIDEDLMDKASFYEHEQVDIYDINNGERFTTYVIKAPRGSKTISVQGAAARKVAKGDEVIICTYCRIEADKAGLHKPIVVLMDRCNNVKNT